MIDEESSQDFNESLTDNTSATDSLVDAIRESMAATAKIGEDVMSQMESLGQDIIDLSQQLSVLAQTIRDSDFSQ